MDKSMQQFVIQTYGLGRFTSYLQIIIQAITTGHFVAITAASC